jgi:hypothetical protein
VLAGFRACGLRADQSVVCANANDIGFMPELSDFNAVVGLPE